MEAAGDVVFRLDPAGRILHASLRATRLINHTRELCGMELTALAAEIDQPALRNAIADAGDAGPVQVRARLKTPENDIWFELRLSRFTGVAGASELLAVGRDMSEQHATEERLRHMATHDALTELPNRLLLSDRIRMVIAHARRSGQAFSVATVGLDGFKKVNDGLGHPVGDAVLRMAAARLRKTLRDSDTLARVGGDEFVAVLPGTFTEAQIRLVTSRLLATFQSPFEVDSHTIHVGASVGVSIYPLHAEDEVRLVALADAAMSRAKETGKARCVVYSKRQGGPPEHDISLEAAMFQALREGEFQLYYQPIVDTRTRRIQGFETLMRWKHPALGMVPPARFIPIAETNGLINLLGAWALKAACVQLRRLNNPHGANCTSRSISARASSATINSSMCSMTPSPTPACAASSSCSRSPKAR
jgi:diguanylate cyclase (GGDEF)-like protein